MAGWFFKPLEDGDTPREPIQSEFFATDAISDPGVALIREGFQNSMDAARADKVLVRVRLVDGEKCPDYKMVEPFIAGAWEHIKSEDNGLRPDQIPQPEGSCPYLILEDFGTSGLEGDPTASLRPKSREKNHFLHFFRAEGQSDKEASDRGSWGVGKTVFPRSSRISGMFGLTVRASDSKCLLMGRLIYRSHYVGDSMYQDGYYGISTEGIKTILPIEEQAVLDRFAEVFDLQRGDHEPGLSVVVPWPDSEIKEESIARAVLMDYFYPILVGQLEVMVETEGHEALITTDSIREETGKIGADLADDLLPMLDLTEWAIGIGDEERVTIEMTNRTAGWKWSKDLFTDESLSVLTESFQQGRRVAVRVPVMVRRKAGAPEESFFDVYMERDPYEKRNRPIFVRDGIIIPKVASPQTRGVRGIVLISDPPIASFLRDAENPSHTEWQHNGSNFYGKYVSGRTDLQFVTRCVHEIRRILTEESREEDPDLLKDYFSLPAPETAVTRTRQPGQQPGEGPEEVPPLPPPEPAPFQVGHLTDGFVLRPGRLAITEPLKIKIELAYDVRSGNPLNSYSIFDFEVDKDPIRLEPPPQGLEVVRQERNIIEVKLLEPDFRISVVGFDTKRDLYINAKKKGNADGSTEV